MNQTRWPADEQEFREALAALVFAAHANGVDVFGGWDIFTRGAEGADTIGIEIYPVASKES